MLILQNMFNDYCEKFPDMMFGDLFDAQFGNLFPNVKLSDLKKYNNHNSCTFRSKSNGWNYVCVSGNYLEYWSDCGGWGDWVPAPNHIIVKLLTEGKEDFGV